MPRLAVRVLGATPLAFRHFQHLLGMGQGFLADFDAAEHSSNFIATGCIIKLFEAIGTSFMRFRRSPLQGRAFAQRLNNSLPVTGLLH